jgi:hypothetical protein
MMCRVRGVEALSVASVAGRERESETELAGS